MRPLVKLAAFAAVLALIFGGGLAVGAAVGPLEDPPPPSHGEHMP